MYDRPPEGPPHTPAKRGGQDGKAGKPGWADGLRKLYDGVVAEPLPDSFEDLLKRLDQAGND
ncbi:MAG: NepR family anti-sigma factor [Novosphingobium sp.]